MRLKTGIIIKKNDTVLGFSHKTGFFIEKSLFLNQLNKKIIWFSNMEEEEINDLNLSLNIKSNTYFKIKVTEIINNEGFSFIDVEKNPNSIKFILLKLNELFDQLIKHAYHSYRKKDLEKVNTSNKLKTNEEREILIYKTRSYFDLFYNIKKSFLSINKKTDIKEMQFKVLKTKKHDSSIYLINENLITKIKEDINLVIGFYDKKIIKFEKPLRNLLDIESSLLDKENLLFLNVIITKVNSKIRLFKNFEGKNFLMTIKEFLFFIENDFEFEIDYYIEYGKKRKIAKQKMANIKSLYNHKLECDYKQNKIFDLIIAINYIDGFIFNDNILFNKVILNSIFLNNLEYVKEIEDKGIEVIEINKYGIKIAFDDEEKIRIKNVLNNLNLYYTNEIL